MFDNGFTDVDGECVVGTLFLELADDFGHGIEKDSTSFSSSVL